MAIPGSGALSAQTINFELGRSRASTMSIDTAENGGYGAINQNSPNRPNAANPAAYSEWYGYDHNAFGGGPSEAFEIPLGYHPSDQNRACSGYYFDELPIRFIDTQLWEAASAVWDDPFLTIFSPAGWYSDGNTNRFLSVNRGGATFTITTPCTL